MKYLFLVLLLVGCNGLDRNGERQAENLPSTWRSFVTVGNNIVYLIPATMDDGTRCVVLTSNGNRGGISCDWGKK